MNWQVGDSTAELREAGGSYMRFFSQAEFEADPSLLVNQGIAVDGGYMFSVCSGCPATQVFGWYEGEWQAGKNAPDAPYPAYFNDQVVHKHIMHLTAVEAAQVIAGAPKSNSCAAQCTPPPPPLVCAFTSVDGVDGFCPPPDFKVG